MSVTEEANRSANLEDIEGLANTSLREIKADMNKRGKYAMTFSNKSNFKKISGAYTKILKTLCEADKPLTEDEQRISAKYKATVEEVEEQINKLSRGSGSGSRSRSGSGSRSRGGSRRRRSKRHTRSKKN